MKKLLSVLLAVAMLVSAMSVLSLTASAASDDVCLYAGLLKDADGNAVSEGTDDANHVKWSYANNVLTIESTSDEGCNFDIWDVCPSFDVATQKGIILNYVSDVPFFMCVQVTAKAGEKWPGTGTDFYNTFGYGPSDLIAGTYGSEEVQFMPAASKSGIINLNGFFTWDAKNGNDQTPADGKSKISLVNIKLKGKGKVDIYALHLTTDEPTEEAKEGGASGYLSGGSAAPAGDATTAAGNTNNTTAAASGTAAKTGDADNVMLVAMIAVISAAAVTMSVVAAKKAKSK